MGTLKDVAVNCDKDPTVAPGMVTVTVSPATKLLPATEIVWVVPFSMVPGFMLVISGL